MRSRKKSPSVVHAFIQKKFLNWPIYNKALGDISVIRCAVNMEVVNLDFSIDDNDEIALFPPMTGG